MLVFRSRGCAVCSETAIRISAAVVSRPTTRSSAAPWHRTVTRLSPPLLAPRGASIWPLPPASMKSREGGICCWELESKQTPVGEVGETDADVTERNELLEVWERPVPRERRLLARAEIFSSTGLRSLGEDGGGWPPGTCSSSRCRRPISLLCCRARILSVPALSCPSSSAQRAAACCSDPRWRPSSRLSLSCKGLSKWVLCCWRC